MNLGDITAAHVGRTIKVQQDAPARVIAGVRHFTVPDPDGGKSALLRLTSVMLGSTGAKGADHLGEHLGNSSDEVAIGNG